MDNTNCTIRRIRASSIDMRARPLVLTILPVSRASSNDTRAPRHNSYARPHWCYQMSRQVHATDLGPLSASEMKILRRKIKRNLKSAIKRRLSERATAYGRGSEHDDQFGKTAVVLSPSQSIDTLTYNAASPCSVSTSNGANSEACVPVLSPPFKSELSCVTNFTDIRENVGTVTADHHNNVSDKLSSCAVSHVMPSTLVDTCPVDSASRTTSPLQDYSHRFSPAMPVVPFLDLCSSDDENIDNEPLPVVIVPIENTTIGDILNTCVGKSVVQVIIK